VHDKILDSRLRGNDGLVKIAGTEVSSACSWCPAAG
jgi:hypothetical protein